jgi:hypothetical protein
MSGGLGHTHRPFSSSKRAQSPTAKRGNNVIITEVAREEVSEQLRQAAMDATMISTVEKWVITNILHIYWSL